MKKVNEDLDFKTSLIQDDFYVAELSHHGITEYFITAAASRSKKLAECVFDSMDWLKQNKASIISHDLYGPADSSVYSMIKGHPFTWIHPLSDSSLFLGGIQIWAVNNTDVQYLNDNSQIIASTFCDEQMQYYRLAGLGTAKPGLSRAEQTRLAFMQLEQTLAHFGIGFGDTVRTWFYNEDILDWYKEFNHERDAFFHKQNLPENRFPASTGIGASNAAGSALTAGLLAVKTKDQSVKTGIVISPMQDEAWKYGSSFSRAFEIVSDISNRVFISGTASISFDGKTVFQNQGYEQIDLTMKIVHELLQTRSMTWGNITRAVAYFRKPEYFFEYKRWLKNNPSCMLPVIPAHSVVCRDDLLFEIELDAVRI